MKRGNIPGFYYDEVKQKYFRIQPNHVAPSDAKYTQANVSKEKRENKKRRIEQRKQQLRRKQTVVRSSTLTHPTLADVGLDREHGRAQGLASRHRWEALQTRQLQPRSFAVTPYRSSVELLDAIPLPDTNHVAAALLHHGDVSSAELSDALSESAEGPNNVWIRVAVFNSPIVSMSVVGQGAGAAANDRWLICAQRPTTPGNVYFGTLRTDPGVVSNGFYLKLGSVTSCLWASSTQRLSEWSAISGTEDVFVLNERGDMVARQSLPAESRSVAWLDRNTVCYGYGSRVVESGIRLWDIRSGGVALRFPAKHAITGLLTLNDSTDFLASENRRLCLYDTRALKLPLLKIDHVHHGPKLHFAQIANDIVVAVDSNNDIGAYSLRQGRPVGAVTNPPRKSQEHITSLRAFGGMSFQACQGRMVHLWEQ